MPNVHGKYLRCIRLYLYELYMYEDYENPAGYSSASLDEITPVS
jgi:hypothetical protein